MEGSWPGHTYTVQRFAVFVETRVDGLEVFLRGVERLLERVLKLCQRQGCRFGIWSCAVSASSIAERWGTLTGCNLGPGGREHVNRPLDVVDARGEVCAAFQKLHLLAEVVHGGGGRWNQGRWRGKTPAVLWGKH